VQVGAKGVTVVAGMADERAEAVGERDGTGSFEP